jgi:transcriptional regulator with XRE-family HTH domain
MTRFDAAGLAARREHAGLTRLQLADKIGATTQAVGYWERGEFTPSASWIPLLAAALGCGLDELYTDTSEEAADTAQPAPRGAA